jgi:hypothetical protein
MTDVTTESSPAYELADDQRASDVLDPYLRHGVVASDLAGRSIGPAWKGNPYAFAAGIRERGEIAQTGDLAGASHMLMAQAQTLDAIFTEAARRMTQALGGNMAVFDIYARVALKAQANSRATLEALAKLHQPREQVVRHVHVNEGGQAVIADEFHHHAGGQGNGEAKGQPYEPHGAAGGRSALPGAQQGGSALPVPSDEGTQALPASRGLESRRTDRKPARAQARRVVG